jgi:hypothetical protein
VTTMGAQSRFSTLCVTVLVLGTCGCRGGPPSPLEDEAGAPDSAIAPEAGEGGARAMADAEAGSPPVDGGADATELSDGGADAADACSTANTLEDPNNCGRCGHSCQGGGCDGGACESVVIANGVPYPAGIAVYGNDLYWAQLADSTDNYANGAVKKIALFGPTKNTPVPIGGAQVGPNVVAINSGGLYWVSGGNGPAEPGGLEWSSDATSTPTAIDPWDACTTSLALTATGAYWMTCASSGSGVKQSLTTVAVPSQGASSQGIVGSINCVATMGADDASVYWIETGCHANSGSIHKVSFSDPTDNINLLPQTTLSAPFGNRMAVDPRGVYFSAGNAGLLLAPLAGGNPTTINATALASAVAVDATTIYWTDTAQGALLSAPLPSGTPVTTLVSGLTNPYDIVLDADSIYWSNSTSAGSIMKVAKP